MKLFSLGIQIVLLAGTLAAQNSSSTPAIDPAFFPYSQGWLGADAAYSISLDRFSTVWLFGDTFVGKRRTENAMIHNSIAIRTCKEGCNLSYWWSGMHTDKPDSFFKTPESNYYWPLDGFVYRGKLYIFLEQMHATGHGGAFGFDYSCIKLATISNPAAKPSLWHISYRTISTGNEVIPGIATTLDEKSDHNYAYVFALLRQSAKQRYVGLMRFQLDGLASEDAGIRWQYLSGSDGWQSWSPSKPPENALKMLSGNITEMSVKYHPELDHWIAVFPTPGFLSTTASYSKAVHLSGPWTVESSFFAYPEMQRTNSSYTPDVFCYAAKEHPELEANGELAFTYACNSTKEQEIFVDMRLYRPELVKEKVPVFQTPQPNVPSK